MKFQLLIVTALLSFATASAVALDKRAHITGDCTKDQWEVVVQSLNDCEAIAEAASNATVTQSRMMEEFFKYVHF